MSRVLLEVDALTVGYSGTAILPPASFNIEREELWALVGPNGAGKTTLLRTLLGLLQRVDGNLTWREGARIAYVPQRSELDLSVPMRVCDVVAQGVDSKWSFLDPGVVRRERKHIESVLAETNMAHLFNQPFRALSDGQRQRVLLSRALAAEPDVLVLDEPTNGMDIVAEKSAFDLFVELKATRKLAIIAVSHHMPFLASRASHVMWVDRQDGIFVAGELENARLDPRFVAHYGAVFGIEPPRLLRTRAGDAA